MTMGNGGNIGWPLTFQIIPISTFCIAFHIFIAGENRNFKFGLQVDHSKSQSTDDKLSLKGARSHHVTYFKYLIHFKFLVPKISLKWLKLDASTFVHWLLSIIISAKWTEWTARYIVMLFSFLPSVCPSVCAHSVFRCKYLENGLR